MQLTEQSLGLLQIERIEALGEPAVERGEKIAGFAAPVLFAPEARQADRCPEFQERCALELSLPQVPIAVAYAGQGGGPRAKQTEFENV